MTPSIALLLLSTVLVFTWMSSESSTLTSITSSGSAGGLLTNSVDLQSGTTGNGPNLELDKFLEFTKLKNVTFGRPGGVINTVLHSSLGTAISNKVQSGEPLSGDRVSNNSRTSRLCTYLDAII